MTTDSSPEYRFFSNWIEAISRCFENSSRTVKESNNGNGKKIFAIGGGKGGIGKSVITANLGISLALNLKREDKKVILIDCDLGCGNLSSCLGINEPPYTLKDFILGTKNHLDEIVLDTPVESLKLISGSNGVLGMANIKYSQKKKFIDQVRKLNADFIILDLGAGNSYNVLDLFLVSDEGIVVTTPDRISTFTSYGFLKNCLLRKLIKELSHQGDTEETLNLLTDTIDTMQVKRDKKTFSMNELIDEISELDTTIAYRIKEIVHTFKPKLIVNMVEKSYKKKFGNWFKSSVKDTLTVELDYLGHVHYDEEIQCSTKKMEPVIFDSPAGRAANCFDSITQKLLGYDKKKFTKDIFDIVVFRKNDTVKKEIENILQYAS